jgi:hypothetical protein
MKPVTLVVTSCKRFDLLERTLSSFHAFNDYPLARTLIVEDSDDTSVHELVRKLNLPNTDVIVNGTRVGLCASVDRAYARVETDYIFHCEDDWLFCRPGIVRESIEILDSDPNILMVLARRREDHPYYFTSIPIEAVGSARFRKIGPSVHQVWFTFSFNPGLRRLSDYKRIPGGYASLGSELAISQFYKRAGRSMAVLEDARVIHLGSERSTNPAKYRRSLRATMRYRVVDKPISWFFRMARHYARMLGLSDGF